MEIGVKNMIKFIGLMSLALFSMSKLQAAANTNLGQELYNKIVTILQDDKNIDLYGVKTALCKAFNPDYKRDLKHILQNDLELIRKLIPF